MDALGNLGNLCEAIEDAYLSSLREDLERGLMTNHGIVSKPAECESHRKQPDRSYRVQEVVGREKTRVL